MWRHLNTIVGHLRSILIHFRCSKQFGGAYCIKSSLAMVGEMVQIKRRNNDHAWVSSYEMPSMASYKYHFPVIVYSMRTTQSFFFSTLLICSYYNISLYMLLLLLLLYLVVLTCFGAHVRSSSFFKSKNIHCKKYQSSLKKTSLHAGSLMISQ